MVQFKDPVLSRLNEKQRKQARLGKSGKYYCTGFLDDKCNCCSGKCGPDDGCNCSGCMKLDVEARGLPRKYLVNREGFTARRGNTDKFYCGRKCIIGIPFCDGYCGPENGPSCPSCQTLDDQSKSRYKELS